MDAEVSRDDLTFLVGMVSRLMKVQRVYFARFNPFLEYCYDPIFSIDTVGDNLRVQHFRDGSLMTSQMSPPESSLDVDVDEVTCANGETMWVLGSKQGRYNARLCPSPP